MAVSLGPALPGHIPLGVLTCPWPFPGSEALHPCCALLSEPCLHISTSPYPGAHLLQTPYEAGSRVPPPPGAPHTDALLCFCLSVCPTVSIFSPQRIHLNCSDMATPCSICPFGQKAACLTLQEVMLFHRAGDLLGLEAVKESWVQACFC